MRNFAENRPSAFLMHRHTNGHPQKALHDDLQLACARLAGQLPERRGHGAMSKSVDVALNPGGRAKQQWPVALFLMRTNAKFVAICASSPYAAPSDTSWNRVPVT